jgi:hypothetical protein
LYARSREGEQQFDAYGYSQFSGAHRIADYVFTYTGHDDAFFTATASGGYTQQDTALSSNILNVSSVSGSSVSKTSYISYPYVPGNGTFMSTSLSCGDIGKDGVVRRWGLFDDEDGLYFQLDGTSFSVNIRNSITGLTTTILQEDFNEILPYTLDFSKFNLYWMDYQWQGVGRVRFGLYNPDGSRQVLHTIENANNNSTPYMRRGTLPFKMEMYNKQNTSSASQMLITCLAISRQGSGDEVETNGREFLYTSDLLQVGSSASVPFLSATPKQYFNGVTNRTVVYPTSFEVCSVGGPVRLDIFIDGDLIDSTYSLTFENSSLLLDNSATDIINGGIKETLLFPEGTLTRKGSSNPLKNTLTLFPNLYQPQFTFAFKSLIPGLTASVLAVIRWKEVY